MSAPTPVARAAALLLLLAAPGIAPATATAQDRLVGARAAGAGASLELVRFGDGGFLQADLFGPDSLRVRRVAQLSVPVTAVTPLGGGWTLDATTVYATGSVTYDRRVGGRAVEQTATLAGISDVRLRAVGRLFGDRLVLTAGANLPSGRTRLDAEQLTALRGLAAPALGLLAPPVGQGPSGTFGLLAARSAGGWSLAGGLSYEVRGTFAPVAALVAGAPSIDFRPGNVVRGSLSGDRLVGRNRLSVALSADVFTDDRLRAGAVPTGSGGSAAGAPTLAVVRLGPLVTTDVQLQLAAPRFREVVLYATNRWRARFARDGVTVPGSDANYLEGGLRGSLPLALRTDLVMAVDGRWHTGLALDEGLPTAGVASGGLTLGLARTVGLLSVQPFLRGQAGRLRGERVGATAFSGGAAGLSILTRF